MIVDGINVVRELLNACVKIDKIFAINNDNDDIVALTVERICAEFGISIPEDLSIISFNNSLLSRINTPQLTSININSFQLGIEAASQMINHIENPNLLATKIIVPHQLIERNSCKNIKRTSDF